MARPLIFFDFSRFMTYLNCLKVFYLRKSSIPFAYVGIIFLLAVLNYLGWSWNLFDFLTSYFFTNISLLVIVSTASTKIFNPLFDPATSLQEYNIPISLSERFWGNFIFYGLLYLGWVHLWNNALSLLFAISDPDDLSLHLSSLWGNYLPVVTLLDYLSLYVLFFSGGIYFTRHPILKTLFVVMLAYILYSKGIGSSPITTGGFQFTIAAGGAPLDPLVRYSFLTVWLGFSFLKLSRQRL